MRRDAGGKQPAEELARAIGRIRSKTRAGVASTSTITAFSMSMR
jgi:hypothetical protein